MDLVSWWMKKMWMLGHTPNWKRPEPDMKLLALSHGKKRRMKIVWEQILAAKLKEIVSTGEGHDYIVIAPPFLSPCHQKNTENHTPVTRLVHCRDQIPISKLMWEEAVTIKQSEFTGLGILLNLLWPDLLYICKQWFGRERDSMFLGSKIRV